VKLSQFVLRPEATKVRESVEEGVVESCLYWNASTGGASLDSILKLLPIEFSLSLTRQRLKQTLDRLVDKGSVTFDGGYHLTTVAAMLVKKATLAKSHEIDSMIEDLIRGMQGSSGTLQETDRNSIIDAFYYFVSSFLNSRADFVKGSFLGTVNYQELEPSRLLDEAARYITNPNLAAPFRALVSEMLSKPTPDVIAFFGTACQNIVALRTLNVDPDCRSLEREAFASKTLFIDTNVMMGLVCTHSELHQFSQETIAICKDLGVRLVVTKRTLQEFRSVLDFANERIRKLKASTSVLIQTADDFLSSFAKEKMADQTRTWEAYYLEMTRVQTRIKKEWGIEVDNNDYAEVRALSGFEKVQEAVSECPKEFGSSRKEMHVAEHDAFHLLLVRTLRTAGQRPLLGPTYWFLTLDRSLLCAEEVVTEVSATERIPSSIECDLWLSLISPVLPQGEAKGSAIEVFKTILMSRFSRTSQKVTPEDLLSLQGEWLQYEFLTADDVESILGEKFVSDYLKLARKTSHAGQALAAKPNFEKELTMKVDGIIRERLKLMSKELADLKTRDKALRDEVAARDAQLAEVRAKNRETDFKLFWRTIAGILGAILVLIDAFRMTGIIGALGGDAVTAGTLLSGVILLLIAIAYEQVLVRIAPR
jgi:predicted nucleic acid-binding protein